jgi:hypothetical protein
MTFLHDLIPMYGQVESTVELDLGISILFMTDGCIRVAHNCKLIGPGERIRCAPALMIGQGHTVVTRDPLTIVASILCTDCGLHGFVTNGEWIPA